MAKNKITNYYLIFKVVGENKGEMVCIVSDEDVAIQFCRDFKEFYYLERERIVR